MFAFIAWSKQADGQVGDLDGFVSALLYMGSRDGKWRHVLGLYVHRARVSIVNTLVGIHTVTYLGVVSVWGNI